MSIERRYPLLKHQHDAADITTGTFAPARLGSGTADTTVFLRGDSTWSNTLNGQLNLNGGRLNLTNQQEGVRINHAGAFYSAYNDAGTTRSGYLQFAVADAIYLVAENAGNRFVFLATGEKLRIDTNALHATGQVRATGWYGSNATVGGPAAEIGYSGGTAFLIGYDRSLSAYQPLGINGSQITITGTGTGATGVLQHSAYGSGSSKEWRFLGSSGTAYFFNGATEDIILRPGTSTGGFYAGPLDALQVRPDSVGINVRITSQTSSPWGIGLYRVDYGADSKVFNHKFDGTNMGWAFEHMPYVKGIRDYGGGVARIETPNTTGVANYWYMYGNAATTVGLRLFDSAGSAKVWLYGSGSDFGLLDGPGSWAWRYDSANVQWVAASGVSINVSGLLTATSTSGPQICADASSGSAYVRASRASSATGEVGYRWDQAGSPIWYCYVPTSDTTLTWYSNASGSLMTLDTSGNLKRTGKGAYLYHGSSSFASGSITVQSGGSASGGSDGDIFLIY